VYHSSRAQPCLYAAGHVPSPRPHLFVARDLAELTWCHLSLGGLSRRFLTDSLFLFLNDGTALGFPAPPFARGSHNVELSCAAERDQQKSVSQGHCHFQSAVQASASTTCSTRRSVSTASPGLLSLTAAVPGLLGSNGTGGRRGPQPSSGCVQRPGPWQFSDAHSQPVPLSVLGGHWFHAAPPDSPGPSCRLAVLRLRPECELN